MMLEYEWGNPAAAAAAMMLFGDETGQETGQDQRAASLFDHYSSGGHHHHHHHHHMGGHDGGGGCDLFPLPQQTTPLTAAALFSPLSSSSMATSCHPRYGLGLPPAPARIGLNLGVRTYFSSASPESPEMVLGGGGRAPRRRTRTARCQAEGCGADLTGAKHYHRRHKVCEFHSKASIVIAAGISQRFCQQCSRFHVLSEFDQGKRSCRKRLADHNRRRRKSQDLSTPTFANNVAADTDSNNINAAAAGTDNPEKALFATTGDNTRGAPDHPTSLFPGCKPETESSVTQVSSPAAAAAPPQHVPSPGATQMMLGLGCGGGIAALIPAAPAGMSASSSSGNSPPSVSFLSHLVDFRGHEHRFSGWDETEDGSSVIKGLYQSK